MGALEIQPCRAVCTWAPTSEQLAGERLFRCGGCGSEWVRSQGWTPVDAGGVVPHDVAAEAALRRR